MQLKENQKNSYTRQDQSKEKEAKEEKWVFFLPNEAGQQLQNTRKDN